VPAAEAGPCQTRCAKPGAGLAPKEVEGAAEGARVRVPRLSRHGRAPLLRAYIFVRTRLPPPRAPPTQRAAVVGVRRARGRVARRERGGRGVLVGRAAVFRGEARKRLLVQPHVRCLVRRRPLPPRRAPVGAPACERRTKLRAGAAVGGVSCRMLRRRGGRRHLGGDVGGEEGVDGRWVKRGV
jgi:hypothetical protein